MQLPLSLFKTVVRFGSIWRIPNKVWQPFFAQGKPSNDFHPGLIVRENQDNYTYQLSPGTSKSSGSNCVFKLASKSKTGRTNYLLRFSFAIDTDELSNFQKGFGGIDQVPSELELELRSMFIECSSSRRINTH